MFEILLHPDSFNAVRSGTKRTIIRRGHRTDFGPMWIINSAKNQMTIEADVHRTVLTMLDRINEEEARADGFLSLGQLHNAMQRHYPDIVITDPVTIYHFTRTDRDGG